MIVSVEAALIVGTIAVVVASVTCLIVGVYAGRKSAFREALRHFDRARELEKGIREGKPAAQYRGALRGRRVQTSAPSEGGRK